MLVTESPKRKQKKRREAVLATPPLPPEDAQSLRDFIRFALGDGHVTAWEENFLNTLKHLLYRPAIWLSAKERMIVHQLEDKLHYNRQDVPLPPVDPDGIEENDDPDGWPAVRHMVDQFDDEELLDRLPQV